MCGVSVTFNIWLATLPMFAICKKLPLCWLLVFCKCGGTSSSNWTLGQSRVRYELNSVLLFHKAQFKFWLYRHSVNYNYRQIKDFSNSNSTQALYHVASLLWCETELERGALYWFLISVTWMPPSLAPCIISTVLICKVRETGWVGNIFLSLADARWILLFWDFIKFPNIDKGV